DRSRVFAVVGAHLDGAGVIEHAKCVLGCVLRESHRLVAAMLHVARHLENEENCCDHVWLLSCCRLATTSTTTAATPAPRRLSPPNGRPTARWSPPARRAAPPSPRCASRARPACARPARAPRGRAAFRRRAV